MDNDNPRATIARHVRELRRHLLPILDWIENELGPPAPEMDVAHAIETALGMEPSEGDEPLNDRHYWVLSQLAQDVKLTKHHVITQYGFSERSAKRILSSLTKRGLIEFCADPRPGFYKLCNPDLLKDIDPDLIAGPWPGDAADPETGTANAHEATSVQSSTLSSDAPSKIRTITSFSRG